MARTIYLTAPEGDTGKSVIALGLLDLLTRTVQKVGVFRPIARSTEQPDWVVELLLAHEGIDTKYDDAIGVTYEEVIADPDAALSTIVSRFHDVERANDAVLVVGSDYTGLIGPTELAYNARVAANLGAPVVLVVRGLGRSPEEIHQVAEVASAEMHANHAQVVAVIANRCEPSQLHEI
ncbi:MAG: AAA family ATPase, partial [Actinobacteria bacterium]|nr:AAA family ATPase [Actinomycetota bacterium]